MFPLTITKISDEKDLKSLKEFMLKQHQFYPRKAYQEWVDGKCSERIESGIYKTILALSQNILIGECVYRSFEDDSVEIKNFRIDDDYQARDLGHFLLRQVEVETGTKLLSLDVTVDNFSGVQFFIRNGFNIKAKANLYASNQYEYLMSKSLGVQKHL